MCGRFDLIKKQQDLERYYHKTSNLQSYKPNYNASPAQTLPVVTSEAIEGMHWGLVPQWAKGINTGYSMINSRAETLMEKRTFTQPFLHSRCLVPATGFYEWKGEGKNKIPYHFSIKSRELFSFAGIYIERKMPEDKILRSFSIITTEANSIVKPIHDKHRMPVILDQDEEAVWLNSSNQEPTQLLLILNKYPAIDMDVWRVSSEVNSSRINSPDLIKPIPA